MTTRGTVGAMRRSTPLFLLVIGVFLATSALAANEKRRKVAEYQDITDEDRAAARERARSRLGSFQETAPPQEYKFPWMAIGFAALTLGIAAPFAWGAYKRASKEQDDANAFAPGPRKRVKATSQEPAEDEG